jgi:3-oxo-5-alpha-steroid 4-dehydrogenase
MEIRDSLARAAVQCWLNCCDRLVVPVFLALSAIAPLALVAPTSRHSHCHPILFFGRLASHGKTLHCVDDDGIRTSCNVKDKTSPFPSRSTSKQTTPSVVMSGWTMFFDELFLSDGWFYVPKRYFAHFYLVGIVQLLLCASMWQTSGPGNAPPLVWLLLGSHLVRRYGECLYVHKWTPQSRMHVAGYLLGIVHYLLLPLVFCPDEASTTTNPQTAINNKDVRSGSRLVGQFACVMLCLYAQYQQHRHHCILASLRNSPTPANSLAVYAIPNGGWFRFLSSPHYLAEIVMYASLVVLAALMAREGPSPVALRQQSLRGCALLLWVADNLVVSAISTHRWYLRRFPDEYPKLNRKAIVPYLL